jgi:hypothetical protein
MRGAFHTFCSRVDRALRGAGERLVRPASDATGPGQVSVDVGRTASVWYQRFFALFPEADLDDLLDTVRRTPPDPYGPLEDADLRTAGFYGWAYWLVYLAGYADYIDRGLTETNPHLRYLVHGFTLHRHDPGLEPELTDPAAARLRAVRRFRDVDRVRQQHRAVLDPLVATVGDAPSHGADPLYVVGRAGPLLPRAIDGYHRVFLAELLGLPQLPCRVVTERAKLPLLRGRVTRLASDAEGTSVHGWCVAGDGVVHVLELRLGNESLAWSAALDGSAARALDPQAPAGASAFAFDFSCTIPGWGLHALAVIGWRDFAPVARLGVADAGR